MSERLILGVFLCVAGCTKAALDFEVLDEDRVPRLKFAGSFTKSLATYSDAMTFQIEGECDPKIRSITGQVGGVSIAVSGIKVTCASDNKFSFELKSLAALGYTVSEGSVYEIELRAETSSGPSKPSYIRILYTSAAGGTLPVLITAGGTGSTLAANGPAAISASVRINNKINRAPNSVQTNGEEAFLKTDGTAGGISVHIGARIHH